MGRHADPGTGESELQHALKQTSRSKKNRKKRGKKKIKVRIKKHRPAEKPTVPPLEHSQSAPNLVTDSERDTPDLERAKTTLQRTDSVDTKAWLERDQERHKEQVRASLWSVSDGSGDS